MDTIIISGFPGIGKSYYVMRHPKTALDSDSSLFSWTIKDGERIRNPKFPDSYIQHIKENIGKYEYIFVSTHVEVRNALVKSGLYFYLLYPDRSRKDEFVKRYKQRGSSPEFIKLVSDNWDKWIDECEACDVGCWQVRMSADIEDELKGILH